MNNGPICMPLMPLMLFKPNSKDIKGIEGIEEGITISKDKTQKAQRI